jgi:hypothetical protein
MRTSSLKLLLCVLIVCGCAGAEVNGSGVSGNPCVDSRATIQSIALNASTTSAVQIIALSGTTKIYPCSITVLGGGTTPTFSLVYGTGTNCATGQTVLITAIAIPTAAPAQTFPSPVGSTPAGQAVCTLLTGTSPTAKGVLSYVQQ